MADATPHIVWMASPDGSTTYFNERGTAYTGCPRETNYGWNWVTLVHPDDIEGARAAWETAVRTEADFVLDYRIRRFDGEFRWHAVCARPARDADGSIQCWIGTATDIEARVELELSLRNSEREALETVALLQSIDATAPVGFKLVDRDLRVLRINDTLAKVHGVSPDEVVGLRVQDVAPDLWPDLEGPYKRALAGETISGLDLTMAGADAPDRARHWLASYYPVRMNDEIVGVGKVVVEITDRKEAEEFRRVVVDNMGEGLYAIDRDGLITYVNPAALQMLGWTHEELLGRSVHDTVHHQRGDGTDLPASECPILRVLSTGRPVRIADDVFIRRDGSVLPVAYSAAPLRGSDPPEGVVMVFRDITDQKKEQATLERELATLTWIGRIRDALDEDRFVLYSQPIVSLTGGEPSEELLLRMIGRNGEVIAPSAFLPVAERYGLVTEIDRWVITQAVRLAARRNRRVEANLSATSIESPDLVQFIEHQIQEAGADPAHLVFELTETALMNDLAGGMEFARSLRDIGCGLALDDFGTGYNSFTYLKTLPLTYLKIDIEFVRDLTTNPANRHVVDAIVSLAKAFGLQTIAEGVENDETLALLREDGVDFAQGFHLGRPAPIE